MQIGGSSEILVVLTQLVLAETFLALFFLQQIPIKNPGYLKRASMSDLMALVLHSVVSHFETEIKMSW